jgi:Fic family protein
MPDPSVLINTIPLLEAQASSEIENIVTTTDALFRFARINDDAADPAVKETLRYRSALRAGYESTTARALTVGTAIDVCTRIRGVEMGVRDVPGTRIVNPSTREIIYSPPEGRDVIEAKLAAWESFIHSPHGLDPIVRMALAHYQFEAIHPFADGNGRTGRILNILMLVEAGLLQTPLLYLSRHIIDQKHDYYRLLAGVTARGAWEDWVLFMIEAVRSSAVDTLAKIDAISELTSRFAAEAVDVTPGMRHAGFLSVLFAQPYVRIGDVVNECGVSRPTAAAWLNALVAAGMLADMKIGRDRLFLNAAYLDLLAKRDH